MKLAKIFLPALLLNVSTFTLAAEVDEIISTYHESVGGEEALKALTGVKISAEATQGPMTFPIEIVQQNSGKQYTKITVQGQTLMQGVFDGETLWSTNFMTMKPEKAQTEQTENLKLDINDFPDSLIDYKEKGYTAELIGTEVVDGEDAYKIKLTKEPITVEGETQPNVEYYYFDAEAMILVMTESQIKMGPMKGQMQQVKMSDYQEVDGIYFPFSMTQSIKDQPGSESPISIKKIELNPTVSNDVFAFPSAE